MRITDQQNAAFQRLGQRAQQDSAAATAELERQFKTERTDRDLWFARRQIAEAELTLNFPADKDVGGTTVLETMMQSDHYMNVHEIGQTRGVPIAAGRDAYEIDRLGYAALPIPGNAAAQMDRPRYGAINVFVSGRGAAPGYGDCALVLHPDVQTRCTITLMDSLDARKPLIGTRSAFDHCLLHRKQSMGAYYWNNWLNGLLKAARGTAAPNANIKAYVEAQIHAVVEFPADVLYLRASFESTFGTQTGERLQHWARKNDWPLVWGTQDQMLLDPTVQFPRVTDAALPRPVWSDILLERAAFFADFWANLREHNAGKAVAGNTAEQWSVLWSTMPVSQRYSPSQTETVPVTMHALSQRLQRAPQPAPAEPVHPA